VSIDELLSFNRDYVARSEARELAGVPQRHLAVLTCMDTRLDLFGALGVDVGEVHFLRNAGGLATDDVVRSLILSQQLLDTRSIMVIHHTRCGVEGLDEDRLRDLVVERGGARPDFAFGGFRDVEEDVRATVTTLRSSPYLLVDDIRGFVIDVDNGELREVPTVP